MVKLLQDGKPCELDMPNLDIALWYIIGTGGMDEGPVSDERVEFLLKYFCDTEVDDERDDNKTDAG